MLLDRDDPDTAHLPRPLILFECHPDDGAGPLNRVKEEACPMAPLLVAINRIHYKQFADFDAF